MAHRVPITVRLESFEGPLDLLLYLIQSHELDISKVSISKITDQYLAYVRLMQELNFDAASEFLVMAATLLHWKSKAILPQEQKQDANALAGEEQELTQEDLIRQLQEHQRFLAAGQDLAQLPYLGEDVFIRPNRRSPVERIWKEMSLTDLTLSYQEIMIRQRKRTHVLRKETVSLSSKILEFRDRLKVGKLTEFADLLQDIHSRPETVAAFLATLELARLKKMKVHQEITYSPIYVELISSLLDFDLQMASGFDGEQASAGGAAASAEARESADASRSGSLPASLPASRSEDDRRPAMDLTGEVSFQPLAQLEAEFNSASKTGNPNL